MQATAVYESHTGLHKLLTPVQIIGTLLLNHGRSKTVKWVVSNRIAVTRHRWLLRSEHGSRVKLRWLERKSLLRKRVLLRGEAMLLLLLLLLLLVRERHLTGVAGCGLPVVQC